MGRASKLRYLPKRLGEKLLQIRQALGLTQSEMLTELTRYGDFASVTQNVISDYENNRREAPVLVLFAYAQIANVYIDVLVDDTVNLPERLPAASKSAGI